MKYFQIGDRNKLYISYIGLGALHFGSFLNYKQTKSLIDYSLDNGINFIDTAPLYGNGESEIFLKKALKHHNRDKIIIATKFGLKKVMRKGIFGVEVMRLNKKNLEKSLDESLIKMNLDHIDIFQLHAFDKKTNILETFDALKELIKKGKILNVGTSNYSPNEMKLSINAAKKINLNIVTTQLHYNMIERKTERNILKLCKENKIHPISYRALARGILTGKYKDLNKIPKNSRASKSIRVKKWLSKDLINLLNDINEIAKSMDISMTELSLAWQFCNKIKCSTVIGARNINQMSTIIKSSKIDLSKKIYKEIDKCIEINGYKNYVKSMPEVYFEK